MILLSRLNGSRFVVNSDLIQYVEATPDTVITLKNGEKFMVRESVDQVIACTLEWRQRVMQAPSVEIPGEAREARV